MNSTEQILPLAASDVEIPPEHGHILMNESVLRALEAITTKLGSLEAKLRSMDERMHLISMRQRAIEEAAAAVWSQDDATPAIFQNLRQLFDRIGERLDRELAQSESAQMQSTGRHAVQLAELGKRLHDLEQRIAQSDVDAKFNLHHPSDLSAQIDTKKAAPHASS
jgi:hypothetical protein